MDLNEYIQQAKLQVETARAEKGRTSDALKEAQDELFRQNEAVLAPLTQECHRARDALSDAESALRLSSLLRTWLGDTDYVPSILALTTPLDQLPAMVAMRLQELMLIELFAEEIVLTDLGERVVALLRQLD